MRLAVHDLLTMNTNENADESYIKTDQMVKLAEELGYTRYWFSEHHGFDSLAAIAPELLVAYYAGRTKNIRMGTGGTMVMHYSPYKIAEDFKTLEALAPGRIDIGLGRAPGSGSAEIIALAEGRRNFYSDLYSKIQSILDLLSGDRPNNPAYQGVVAYPDIGSRLPQPWMLGSTGQSAGRAAQMGLGYSFVKWFGNETSPRVFSDYKKNFKKSKFFDKPEISISYKVLVADSQDELDHLTKSFEMNHIAPISHKVSRLQSADEVKDYTYSPKEEACLNHSYDKRFIIKGTKDQVRSILEEEIETYNIDELMFYLPIYDTEARKNAYKILADIFL